MEWDEISGARVIVEAGFRDFRVTPSQGSHFFQNLTAFQVGYFTVNPDAGEGFVDWDWLRHAHLRRRRWLRPASAFRDPLSGGYERPDQPGIDLQTGNAP